MEGVCVEEVHTWRVQVWTMSTHRPIKKRGATKKTTITDHRNTRLTSVSMEKHAVQQRKPPSPTAQRHAMTKHVSSIRRCRSRCLATWTFVACQFRGRFLGQRLQLVGAKTR